MSFFRQFPQTLYDLQKNGTMMRITDLFRNVTAHQVKLDPTISYTDYRIIDGARPDAVSQLIYGDPDHYWTFFIVNDDLKSGHASWPMSQMQMETYLTQEYDAYSVIQMADTNTHLTPLSSGSTTVVGIDFVNNPVYVINPSDSSSRKVMKYDPYMQQIWVNNSGSSDTFMTNLGTAGYFGLSNSASGTPLISIVINGSTYTKFYGATSTGNVIVNPFISIGRNAAHHFVFAPQAGDQVEFQGISKTLSGTNTSSLVSITGTIEAYANSYGGVKSNNQYYYYTDPKGFLMTSQDVSWAISNIGSTNAITPLYRITAISYADYEFYLNELRSSIRVVNPTYIRAFVKQYRDLLNA